MVTSLLKSLGIGNRSRGKKLLKHFGLPDAPLTANYFTKPQSRNEGEPPVTLDCISPIDGTLVTTLTLNASKEYDVRLEESLKTFGDWRKFPAPKRGEVIRIIADKLRENKAELAELITLEMGKIYQEALGEVQEAIDIADFAQGLSRQLTGLSMHSERSDHRMFEQWHPLGPIGVITAFNFPMAVWAWNAMIAAVAGNTIIWKPSELTPLCALALNTLCQEVADDFGFPNLFQLVIDNNAECGRLMCSDRRIPLISATGSCAMGRSVAATVGTRLGKTILELGGNSALIVLSDADLELAKRAVVFGAVGTAGQRCTTTRRVLIEKPILDHFVTELVRAYEQIRVGDPFDPETHMGPLIHERAEESYHAALKEIRAEGGEVLFGGEKLTNDLGGHYVQPAIVKVSPDSKMMREETFAPILYVVEVEDLESAITLNNEVSQGLSSAIFTNNLRLSERFLSAGGSDCGIANVNIGTSGAEIGGAFGGEKDTGGGREAGSDSWKQYMRRQTCTVNWGSELPLAQGINFEV